MQVHAALLLCSGSFRERGKDSRGTDPYDIYGLSHRQGPTLHCWSQWGRGLLCCLWEERFLLCLHSHTSICIPILLLGRVATASLSGLETLLEFSVRSYLVGNAGSRPISEAKQPWACLVLRWGTTGEAHVLYSLSSFWREAVEAGLSWRDLAAARPARQPASQPTHTHAHTRTHAHAHAERYISGR